MKRFKYALSVLFLLCFTCASQVSFSQSTANVCAPPPPLNLDNLPGQWSGSYTYQGRSFDLKINFQLQEDKLQASAALPAFEIPEQEFTTWVCKSNEIHMRLDLPNNHAVKFIGVNKNGEISGRFVFNEPPNVCTVAKEKFTLKKTSALASKP